MKKLILFIGCLSLSFSAISCNNFLDIEPEGKIIPKTTDDYRKLLTSAYTAYPNQKTLTTIRTDEVQIPDTDNSEVVTVRDIFVYNDQSADASTKEIPYETFYKVIFYANQTINDGATTMEVGDAKEQLLAEAHALRAMAYFDLVNLFAKPYNPTTAKTDPGIVIQNEVDLENKRPKSTIEEVYRQIHSDIDVAKSKAKARIYEAGLNYRFSKLAILALEARVYLFEQNYTEALKSAEEALSIKNALQNLNSNLTMSVANFQSVESILNLEKAFDQNLSSFIFASEELKQAYDQTNDWRYVSYYSQLRGNAIVVKTGNGDTKISFRTAELYFIKAESFVFLNQLNKATEALQPIIENRYKPEAVSAIIEKLKQFDQNEYKSYLLEERFREFAFEGQRWNDLRRLNQKRIIHTFDNENFVLQQNDPRYTLPFPRKARENNPNL